MSASSVSTFSSAGTSPRSDCTVCPRWPSAPMRKIAAPRSDASPVICLMAAPIARNSRVRPTRLPTSEWKSCHFWSDLLIEP